MASSSTPKKLPTESKAEAPSANRSRSAGLREWLYAFVAVVSMLVAIGSFISAKRTADATVAALKDDHNQQRLSVAVSALSSDRGIGRTSGFVLLRRHTSNLLRQALEDETDVDDRLEAYDLFQTTLDAFEVHLGEAPANAASTGDLAAGGVGYGKPRLDRDKFYALKELKALLDDGESMRELVSELQRDDLNVALPSLDLSGALLYGVAWRDIDFSGLRSRNIAGIDLRGATLLKAKLKEANAQNGYFQCANLEKARLDGANLADADFSGADVSGANFTGADTRRLRLVETHGVDEAIGLDLQTAHYVTPTGVYNKRKCLDDRDFWRDFDTE